MTYILGRYVSEDEMEDYRQQDAEDRMRARLEEMGRRGGPDAPEPCEDCGGTGCRNDQCRGEDECPRCLGTGVQP